MRISLRYYIKNKWIGNQQNNDKYRKIVFKSHSITVKPIDPHCLWYINPMSLFVNKGSCYIWSGSHIYNWRLFRNQILLRGQLCRDKPYIRRCTCLEIAGERLMYHFILQYFVESICSYTTFCCVYEYHHTIWIICEISGSYMDQDSEGWCNYLTQIQLSHYLLLTFQNWYDILRIHKIHFQYE